MSIETETVTHAGGRRRRTRVLVAVIALVVVAAGAAVWAWAARSTPSFRPITLRAVQSSALQPCSLPPLTTDGAGSACDASGTHTYVLGASLGQARVVEASVTGSGTSSGLRIRVDDSGRAVLADVTGRFVGQRVAFVVDGVVLDAAAIATPLETPDLVLGASSSAEAAAGLDLLTVPAKE